MVALGLLCDPTKLRFENHTNKKTLKQAWRFFLLCDLFVTQTYGISNFLICLNSIIHYTGLIKHF